MNLKNYAILHGHGGHLKIVSAVYNPVAGP